MFGHIDTLVSTPSHSFLLLFDRSQPIFHNLSLKDPLFWVTVWSSPSLPKLSAPPLILFLIWNENLNTFNLILKSCQNIQSWIENFKFTLDWNEVLHTLFDALLGKWPFLDDISSSFSNQQSQTSSSTYLNLLLSHFVFIIWNYFVGVFSLVQSTHNFSSGVKKE